MNLRKPARLRAETERLAEVKMRKFARAIPDNAKLINILLRLESPMARDLYSKLKPHLKFEPVSLEVVNGLRS